MAHISHSRASDDRWGSPAREGGAGRAPAVSLARPLALAVLLTVVIFGAYELIERFWLAGAGMDALYPLHLARGIGTTLLVATVVALTLLRSAPKWPVPSTADRDLLASPGLADLGRATHHARWFIAMRWVAVALIGCLLQFSVDVMGWVSPVSRFPLALLAASLAVSNLLYSFLVWRQRGVRRVLLVQGYVDLLILTLVLQFTGGVENPVAPVMLLHVIIGGILLSRRQCFALAATGSVLFATLGFLDWSGWWEPHPLSLGNGFGTAASDAPVGVHTLPLIGRVVFQAAMLGLTAWFVSALADRSRPDERPLQRPTSTLDEPGDPEGRMARLHHLAKLGELAAQVVHDVENPVAVISGNARLLLARHRPALVPEVAEEIQGIVDMADRAQALTQRLLGAARPATTGNRCADVVEPARKTLALIAGHARWMRIEIHESLPASLPIAPAHGPQLEQVFLNLFLNAIEAMPEGGKLMVAGGTIPASGGRPGSVFVSVADTGVGISVALQERVFEPFFTTKADGRGTGLGLSICRELIHNHQGSLWLESVPGIGTRFVMTLPASSEPAPQRREPYA